MWIICNLEKKAKGNAKCGLGLNDLRKTIQENATDKGVSQCRIIEGVDILSPPGKLQRVLGKRENRKGFNRG